MFNFFVFFMLLSPSFFSPRLFANSPEGEMDAFLKKYTTSEGVRYHRLKQNVQLLHLFDRLRNQALPVSKKAQEAYWINLYNIATIKLISDHYPIKSITDLHLAKSRIVGTVLGRTVWKTWKFSVRGRPTTLDKIEHGILRPSFRDFRIHAALVCAARSCPPLRREAYRASRLDQQLDEQMRLWLSDRRKNRYDPKSHTLYLSKIFSWFQSDFTASKHGKRSGSKREKLIEVLLPYMPEKTRNAIQSRKETPKIRYLPYSWALNESK